ncbi:MAG: VOC family protein [Myxococcota bacterium]|nr:VOC family protein [Myxococcota bacterium]
MKLQWSHCVLRVRDLDAMVTFYRDILGLQISDRGPLGPDGPEIVFLTTSSTDHHQLALAATRDESEASSLDHMAFRVPSIAEVRAVFKEVTDDDRVSRVAPVTHGNAISVYFSDPEENSIEIFCDTPWHVAQPQIRGWDPRLTDEEVLASVRDAYSGQPEFGPMASYRAQAAKELKEN